MASLEEIRRERLRKIDLLREKGLGSFPVKVERVYTNAEAIKSFTKLSKLKKGTTLTGRIRALRGQGAIIFFDFDDGTARFQGVLKKEEIASDAFELFVDTVDIGDFVEMTGPLFLTKRGEKTISVSSWRMLAKSLRPLPDKWGGLQDVEERFRRRYLDSIMSDEVKDRFVKRSQIITKIREFLNDAGYLEVETPILQPLAGGALAQPFVTHHNALDMDLFLRIAPELYLKKMVVGGFPKVYELSRNFRNEGIDATHNPEFTMLEFYEAYSDALKQREFVEKLVRFVVKEVFGQMELTIGNEVIDFSKPFKVITYSDLLARFALINDISKVSLEEMVLKAKQLGVKVEPGDSLEKVIDNIYKKTCRPKLIQPTFIIDYPTAFNPFAKRKEDNPDLIDRFQLLAGGVELCNAFSELNDPLDQRARYEEQDKKKRAGDGDVSPSDEDYLEAMEYGMPPAGGVGIGIDRLVMFLTGATNIKEVIYFPTMKPKEEEKTIAEERTVEN